MTDNRTTELLRVGDILWNKSADEQIVVIEANSERVWLRKVQKNDELVMHDGHVWAMLGKKCNVKNMCTQSYAQHVFELDGHVEQAIVATLGKPEIVRCRDCKHATISTTGVCKYCEMFVLPDTDGYGADPQVNLPLDFFCGFAERKEVD